LTFAQVCQRSDGQPPDAFDQRDTQHLGNCPEFADRQGPYRLICFDIGKDIFPFQAQFRMGNKLLGQTIGAGEPPIEIRGQNGQLAVKSLGKV